MPEETYIVVKPLSEASYINAKMNKRHPVGSVIQGFYAPYTKEFHCSSCKEDLCYWTKTEKEECLRLLKT